MECATSASDRISSADRCLRSVHFLNVKRDLDANKDSSVCISIFDI